MYGEVETLADDVKFPESLRCWHNLLDGANAREAATEQAREICSTNNRRGLRFGDQITETRGRIPLTFEIEATGPISALSPGCRPRSDGVDRSDGRTD